MAIQFKCPDCKKILQVPDTAQGKSAKCGGCGKVCTVPSTQAVAIASSTPSSSTASTAPNSPKIKFSCSQCNRVLQVAANLAGKKVRCPCGATQTAPAVAAPLNQPANTGSALSNDDWLSDLTNAQTPMQYPLAMGGSPNYPAPEYPNDPSRLSNPYAPPSYPPPSYPGADGAAPSASSQSASANMYLAHAQEELSNNAYVERGERWRVDWGKMLGGIAMMVGAVVWFVLGLMADRIFFYPPILFILGIIAVVNGLFAGD